jgi:hypothetical protein
MTADKCLCRFWAQNWSPSRRRYAAHTHAVGCPYRTRVDELEEAIAELLYAMDTWSTDECGLHPSAVEAYRAGLKALGVKENEHEISMPL